MRRMSWLVAEHQEGPSARVWRGDPQQESHILGEDADDSSHIRRSEQQVACSVGNK